MSFFSVTAACVRLFKTVPDLEQHNKYSEADSALTMSVLKEGVYINQEAFVKNEHTASFVKETNYYTINANKINVCIYEVTKAPITPARSYSNNIITFSLKNEGFLNKSEAKVQARLIADKLIMQIDGDLKKLVKDYVFVKPNLEHGRVISYDLKDGFDSAADECHYPSIMEEALDEVVHLLSLKIENMPDWRMLMLSKFYPKE